MSDDTFDPKDIEIPDEWADLGREFASEGSEGELGWESEIEHDGSDYTLLPPGDYNFEVVEFERGRHAGSAKLPPCNKAVVYIRVEGPEDSATIKHQLFLHTKTEGILCSFFTAIGQRKHGERLKMDWSKVVGARGRCKVVVEKWTGRDGDEMQTNKIKKFYDPNEKKKPAAATYTPGEF